MSKSDRALTEGPMSSRLFQMAWPMTVGIAATMSVPLMDSYFLGQLGTEPLAAISFTFPVVLTLMSLAIGLGAGTSSVVSRAVGDGDEERAKCIATDASILAFVMITALSVIGFLTIRPVFSLVGAKGEILDLVEAYMRIWYLTLPALAMMMIASNLLRSHGDSRTPGMVMVGIAGVNIVLDPLFIFGIGPFPEMGIEGAAWASFVARILAILVAGWAVIYRDKLIALDVPSLSRAFKSAKNIGRIAVPAAIGNAINPLGITIATALLAGYGADVVAGFGVATRIESFVSIPMLALSASIGPIAGQNFGARKYDRVLAAHRQSYVFCVGWSLVVAVILFFAADYLASLFSEEETVTKTIALYLKIVPATLAGYGVAVVAAGGLNAIGKPLYGLVMYLVRTSILYVPLIYIATTMFELWGVFSGIAVANVLSGIVIAAASLWLLRSVAQ